MNFDQKPRSKPTCTAQHGFSPLLMICLRPECQSRCFICPMCAEYQHNGPNHRVIHLQEFKEQQLKYLSINCQNRDQLFLQQLKSSKNQILNRVSQLQKAMAGIIHKIRLAIGNQFQTIIRSYSADTYTNQLLSLDNQLLAKKIITDCYLIQVIKRNQFQGKIQKIKEIQSNYFNILFNVQTKFIEIVNQVQELKYVGELKRSDYLQSMRNKMNGIKAISNISSRNINRNFNDDKNLRDKIREQRMMLSRRQKKTISLLSDSDSQNDGSRKKQDGSRSSSSERQRSRQKNNNFQRFPQFQEYSFGTRGEQLIIIQENKQIGNNTMIDQNQKEKLLKQIPIGYQNLLVRNQMKEENQNKQIKNTTQNQKLALNVNCQSTLPNISEEIPQKNNKNQNQNNDATIKKDNKTSTQDLLARILSQQRKLQLSKQFDKKCQWLNNKQKQKNNTQEIKKILPPTKQVQATKANNTQAKPVQKQSDKKNIKKEPSKKPTSGLSKPKQTQTKMLPYIHRPPIRPTTMTQQQIKQWFHKTYKPEQVYIIVLSHRYDALGKRQFYWYHKGQFRWSKQQYLEYCDDKPKIDQYFSTLKRYK